MSVPIANLLVPRVQQLLAQKEEERFASQQWLPSQPERFEGYYNCSGTLVEVRKEGDVLTMQPFESFYVAKLQYIDQTTPGQAAADSENSFEAEEVYNFMAHMVGPYVDAPECRKHDPHSMRTYNICPMSCLLRVFEGDQNFFQFTISSQNTSRAAILESQGLGYTCPFAAGSV